MKVLHLTTVATPVAGAELTSVLLARDLPAHGIDFQVCTLSPRGVMHDRLDALGRQSHALDATDPKTMARAVPKLARLIRELKPDVIHGQLFHATVLGVAAAKLARRPFVITRQYVPWDRSLLLRKLDSWAAHLADAVIAISTEAKRFLVEQYGVYADKIRVVHNAADVKRFTGLKPPSPVPAELGNEPRIVYTARFSREKGQSYLIEAMRLLKDRSLDATLLLIGDGDGEQKARAQALDLGVDDRVRFLGWRNDVPQILASSQIYAHPAFEEAFGIAAAEAMAAGLPVVASAIGGLLDIVEEGKTGYLVPAQDPPALANALARLIEDPALRARMGEAARTRALAHFTPEVLTTKYVETFRSLA